MSYWIVVFIVLLHRWCLRLSLEEVLVFCTGADRIPPLGFDRIPSLTFLDNNPSSMLPTASTCSIELRLPTCHKTYEGFKEAITLGLKSHDGFGGI